MERVVHHGSFTPQSLVELQFSQGLHDKISKELERPHLLGSQALHDKSSKEEEPKECLPPRCSSRKSQNDSIQRNCLNFWLLGVLLGLVFWNVYFYERSVGQQVDRPLAMVCAYIAMLGSIIIFIAVPAATAARVHSTPGHNKNFDLAGLFTCSYMVGFEVGSFFAMVLWSRCFGISRPLPSFLGSELLYCISNLVLIPLMATICKLFIPKLLIPSSGPKEEPGRFEEGGTDNTV
jgi:hypothetical protein